MTSVKEKRESLLPGRFAYLMGLYAENYHRLTRLFAPQDLQPGSYISSVDDGLDVRMDIIERHPYTIELHLTYCMTDQETGSPSPSAWLRSKRSHKICPTHELTHAQRAPPDPAHQRTDRRPLA